MKLRTTLLLLVAVLALAAFIHFVERKSDTTSRREELARKALRVEPERISYLRFETGTNLIVECSVKDGVWNVVKPIESRADAGQIDRILSGLRDLPRGEVITSEQRKERSLSLEDYGLEQPRARITLGDGVHNRTILVGRNAPLGPSLYLKETSREDVVATSTNLLGLLPVAVSDLRDRTLFHESQDQVQRLEIGSNSGFLQAARMENGQWLLQQPLVSRASRIMMQRLVDSLCNLRIEEFMNDAPTDLLAYGLDDPPFKVSLWSDERRGETTLLLGNPVPGQNNRIYARLKTGGPVCAVSADILESLKVSVEELRERRLMHLSPYDIASVKIQEGEANIELRRNASGWQMTQPKQWKADELRVRELVNAWASATIVSFIDGVSDLESVGLSPAARTLTFSRLRPGADGQTKAPVPGEDEVVVMISDAPRELGRMLVKTGHEEPLYEVLLDLHKTVSLDPLFYRDRQVLDLDPDSVERITSVIEGRESMIERDASGVFAARQPSNSVVDVESVNGVLQTASKLRALRYVADSTTDLAAYGLAEPSAVLTLGIKGESGLGKSILFGMRTLSGGIYAMLRGQDVVFVLEKEEQERLLRNLCVNPSRSGEMFSDGTNRPSDT